ncbi:MAG: pentapeptide repeat-containing protein, partial [Cyanobacteria bacterium P01_G01_bin.49]
MSDSYPPLHLLRSYSPYPSCVSLKFAGEIAQKTTRQFPLTLTLNLNEQDKSLLDGDVKFGLKGGKLTLTVENGNIIAPQVLLNDAYELVSASDTSATWQYTPQTGQSILKVEIVSFLATIQVISDPISVTLTYDINPSDISITDVEGLWRHDIHPNKQSILERKLAQFIWKLRLSSHLSLLTLSSDSRAHEKILESSITGIDPQTLSQLHQLFESIYNVETNNLLELAYLAELDP